MSPSPSKLEILEKIVCLALNQRFFDCADVFPIDLLLFSLQVFIWYLIQVACLPVPLLIVIAAIASQIPSLSIESQSRSHRFDPWPAQTPA